MRTHKQMTVPVEIVSSEQVALPFSLTCCSCDAGSEIDSPEEALRLGWVRIVEEDGPSWNYSGECPECSRPPLFATKSQE